MATREHVTVSKHGCLRSRVVREVVLPFRTTSTVLYEQQIEAKSPTVRDCLPIPVVVAESSRIFRIISIHFNMNRSATQTVIGGHRGPLLSLPVELLISVFCHLPSLKEAFALFSTCRELQRVWLNNVARIYKHLARQSIPCERHARQFLALEVGSLPESRTISAKEVAQMMKNRITVETAIRKFESKAVARRIFFNHENPYCFPVIRPPSCLTRTERSRFTRSYYQLWGLMKIDDPAELAARLQSMTTKQLLHLRGMICLTRYRKVIWPSQCDVVETSSQHLKTLSSKWKLMSRTEIRRRLRGYKNLSSHSKDMSMIRNYAFDERYFGYHFLYDSHQTCVKDAVCRKRTKEPIFEKETHWELWDGSSDEDI